MIAPGQDQAGYGYELFSAFRRHPELGWDVRWVRRRDSAQHYPADIEWTQGDRRAEAEVRSIARRADVVHLMETFGDEFPFVKRRPRVILQHGNRFMHTRGGPAAWVARAKLEGVPQMVSSLDMTRPAPDDLIWLPVPCDTERMAALRVREYRPTVRPLVIQTPSSRAKKGTEPFLAGVASLAAVADVEIVEGVAWAECIARKARADVIFDQFGPCGYATASIEAWAMGIPTVGGADPWVLDAIRRVVGYLPFHEATPETVGERVMEIITDDRLRSEVRDRGRECLETFHAEVMVLRRLVGVWEGAIG
jgi:hypothetical protein